MKTTRKDFIRCALAAGAFPAIVPSSVLGADAPSNKLQIALIGLGRIGTTMDIGGLVDNQDLAMLTTICDCDSVRLANMKQLAEKRYGRNVQRPPRIPHPLQVRERRGPALRLAEVLRP